MTDNREGKCSAYALRPALAVIGSIMTMVSSESDPGVFSMAAAVVESPAKPDP